MRKRNTQLNIRLTKEELQRLKESAAKANYSVSNYLRTLINGVSPKECPPIEYHKLMDILEKTIDYLEQLGLSIPHIFHGQKEKIDLDEYLSSLNFEVIVLCEVVEMIREAVQLPEVAELKQILDPTEL